MYGKFDVNFVKSLKVKLGEEIRKRARGRDKVSLLIRCKSRLLMQVK